MDNRLSGISHAVFGVRTPRYDTPHYLALQKIMTELSALGEIGATPPVDLLSVLKYLPQRLWGNWRTRAALLRKSIIDLHSPLVDQVIQRREMIGKSDSFLDGVFDQQEKLGLTRNEIDVMCGNLVGYFRSSPFPPSRPPYMSKKTCGGSIFAPTLTPRT